MLDLSQERTEANPWYHDAPHLMRFSYICLDFKIRQVTSLDILIPGLAIFIFVMLYYLFYDICSDMLTCVFCIMFEFFSNDQNYKK